jgi:hypothetical protein
MQDTRVMTRGVELRRPELHVAHEAGGTQGRYGAFGVTWELQADDGALYRALLDRLPPGAAPCAGKTPERAYVLRTVPATLSESRASHLLLADGRPLVRSSEITDVVDGFEDNLRWLVAERSPRKVFLRAGVVGWRDRAIVIAGGPGTGKRTLVRALVGAGANYFSDDYAVLEGNTVIPYPTRRHEYLPTGHVLSHWLDDLAPTRAPRPVPVGVVLFAPYRPGAVFKPKLIARGKALLEMFKHAVAAQRNPVQVLRALETVSRRCNALEGARGDAHAVASYLLDRLV